MRSGLLAAQFRQQLLHDNFLVERPLDAHCLLIRLMTLAAQNDDVAFPPDFQRVADSVPTVLDDDILARRLFDALLDFCLLYTSPSPRD